MTTIFLIRTGALLMFLAVVLGAFAAHGLQHRFGEYEKDIWGKANFYHFVHALGIFLLAIFGKLAIFSETDMARIAGLMLAGLVIFSGSLYLLALTGYRALGMITPIGGTLMIVSWALLFFKARG